MLLSLPRSAGDPGSDCSPLKTVRAARGVPEQFSRRPGTQRHLLCQLQGGRRQHQRHFHPRLMSRRSPVSNLDFQEESETIAPWTAAA